MSDDELVPLLEETVRLLRVIARPQLRELQAGFSEKMLTSPKREAMWEAMNGSRSLAEIAEEAGVTAEAVRQFVREVEEKYPDLVDSQRGGGPQKPLRRII